MGVGIDARIANNLYGGFELSARNLDVPDFGDFLALKGILKQHE